MPPSPVPLPPPATPALTEDAVVAEFHSSALLKDSLAQARAEGLLDDEAFEVGDPNVQIAGPSLALFFAALGAKGNPPTIAAPDGSFALTGENCPPSFLSYFRLWQTCVPVVQRLPSAARHDVSLLLCDKDPLSSPLSTAVVRLASDLKSIGIEITQRRTFQLRYAADLQHALDQPVRTGVRPASEPPATQYEPPPAYVAPEDGTRLTPEQTETLTVIRETLYSALADCIVSTPSIVTLFSRGPDWASRAFFASTCLAILEVCLTRVDARGVRAVHLGYRTPRVIGPRETPPYLRPFLAKLVEVSDAARALAEDDDVRAMQDAAEDGDVTREPRLDRLRVRLENGGEATSPAASADAAVAELANAINELALGMANLPAFRERQADAFKVLVGVSSY